MESYQGTAVKQFLGIGKRSHHSNLLEALYIPTVKSIVDRNVPVLSMYYRVFQTESPLKQIYCLQFGRYTLTGYLDRNQESGSFYYTKNYK